MTVRPRSVHNVSIIGGGFAGTLAAIKLIRAATQPLLVRIIEPRTQLGRGLAYSDQLSAIGPPLRGSRWESSTNVELLQQAIALAARLNATIQVPVEAVAAA